MPSSSGLKTTEPTVQRSWGHVLIVHCGLQLHGEVQHGAVEALGVHPCGGSHPQVHTDVKLPFQLVVGLAIFENLEVGDWLPLQKDFIA